MNSSNTCTAPTPPIPTPIPQCTKSPSNPSTFIYRAVISNTVTAILRELLENVQGPALLMCLFLRVMTVLYVRLLRVMTVLYDPVRKVDIRLPGPGIQTPVVQGRSAHFDD